MIENRHQAVQEIAANQLAHSFKLSGKTLTLSIMYTKVMLQTMLPTLLFTAVMCTVTYYGYFDKAKVELGIGHYAERVIPSLRQYLPDWFKMPFNTLVNVGYVIVGAAWCAISTLNLLNNQFKDSDGILFYVFNFMSCIYGAIQALRIFTQMRGFAVMDQWYTLPFFMWVFIWGIHFKYGWSSSRALILVTLSIFSYTLTLFHTRGFEISLGTHIILAAIGGVTGWRRHPQAKAGRSFIGALISCLGFVVIKLYDLQLPKYHIVFRYISGHFISKIFDVLQIWFVNMFFLAITLAANADEKKKKE